MELNVDTQIKHCNYNFWNLVSFNWVKACHLLFTLVDIACTIIRERYLGIIAKISFYFLTTMHFTRKRHLKVKSSLAFILIFTEEKEREKIVYSALCWFERHFSGEIMTHKESHVKAQKKGYLGLRWPGPLNMNDHMEYGQEVSRWGFNEKWCSRIPSSRKLDFSGPNVKPRCWAVVSFCIC